MHIMLTLLVFPAMLSRTTFEEAAAIARAYDLEALVTDWAPVVYAQAIVAAKREFLCDYLSAYPSTYAMLFSELAKRFRADAARAQHAAAMAYGSRTHMCTRTHTHTPRMHTAYGMLFSERPI